MRTVVRAGFQHLKIGSVGALLLVDAVLLAIAGIDIFRYLRHHVVPVRLLGEASLAPDAWLVSQLVLFAIGSLIMLPIVLAVGRVVFGARRPLRRVWRVISSRHATIPILHISATCVLVVLLATTDRLQIQSGYRLLDGVPSFLFRSWLWQVTWIFRAAWISMSSVAAALLLNALYDWLKDRAGIHTWLKHYMTRTELVDLSRPYYPTHGRALRNFNAAAIGPEIRRIRSRADVLVARYQDAVPASTASANLLREYSLDCVQHLRRLLPGGAPGHDIFLFSGTSRAIEVAVSCMPGPKRLILSPFEHASELAVATWIGSVCDVSVAEVAPSESWLERNESDMQARVIGRVCESIDGALAIGRVPVVLMSEVWWATGDVLPVDAWVETLRARYHSAVRIVVDGAHVPGNSDTYMGLRGTDAYVLSAHKWLFSAEPCGILVAPRNHIASVPYDAWGRDLPHSTASVRVISQLVAALELVSSEVWPDLKQRSRKLKEAFVARLSPRLTVATAHLDMPGSLMTAVTPNTGYRWALSEEGLRRYLGEKRLNASIITTRNGEVWIRFAFPYFLELQDVEFAARRMKTCVRPA